MGTLLPARRTALSGRSRLVIRTDHTRLPRFLPLAGRSLRIGDAVVRVGVPATRSLRSSQAVASRLVVIKGFLEPEGFLDAVRRQLHDLDIKASAELLQRPAGRRFEGRSDSSGGGPVRRTVSIHGKQVVGFPVRVQDLEASASVRLQEVGIGGRRRFGCGIFVPVRSQ